MENWENNVDKLMEELQQAVVSIPKEHEFFLSECATIKEFLRTGIDTIRGIDFPNEGKLLNAMFSLSQGFERFLKVDYALMFNNINGRYPTNDEFKKLGHNIKELFEEVIKYAEQSNIHNEYLLKIKNNEKPYNNIINILSDFASMLRYHNFTMLSSNLNNPSPVSRWHNEVENVIIQNKKVRYKEFMLAQASYMDNEGIGISYFTDYDGNTIRTFKEQYILGRKQILISKYAKMYLCHITKALSKILYEMPNGSMYNEFFWCFSLNDVDLRNRKTLKP